MRNLAEKAGIKINNNKRLPFHCFRKMLLSAAIDSGIGLTVGKILCGKTVDNSDSTYLTTVKLRQHFIQLKRFLTIKQQPKVETEKIESLKMAVNKHQEDLSTQKIIAETVSEENRKLRLQIEVLRKGQSDLNEKVDNMTTMFQETFRDLVKASVEEIVKFQKKAQNSKMITED